MSWIALDDVLGVVSHALDREDLSGPVNAVAPEPVTNAVFMRTLGAVLRRPTFLPVPAVALDLVFGEMARATLLASARVRPARLAASGYGFRLPELEGALRHVLGRA
jgi:NAD dependent epimerase/dehydratase family enzyme